MPQPQERTRARAKRVKEPTIDAQPRPMIDESRAEPLPEEGLSADADELGALFLRDATQQANVESWRGDGVPELGPTEGSPTDAALTGVNFDPDESVWDATADLTLQGGEMGAPPEDLDEETAQTQEPDGAVDVVGEDAIRDGSLLDREGDTLGEVEEATSDTDDTNRHQYMRRPRPRS
jgi:hypothetical protein